MAAARVATEFAQDRLDVVGEIDRPHHTKSVDLDRHVHGQLMPVGRIGRPHFDVGSAVAGRNHNAVVDAGHLFIGRAILDLVGHVGHRAVGAQGRDDQLDPLVSGTQGHHRRFDRQMVEPRGRRNRSRHNGRRLAGRLRGRSGGFGTEDLGADSVVAGSTAPATLKGATPSGAATHIKTISHRRTKPRRANSSAAPIRNAGLGPRGSNL